MGLSLVYFPSNAHFEGLAWPFQRPELKVYFTLMCSNTYMSTTKLAKTYEDLKHTNRSSTK